jgi:hypothetical protein
MNPIVIEHFDTVEQWLLQSPAVISYKITRKEVALTDGKLRVNVSFVDKSMAELFEYVIVTQSGLNLSKYSFHWQDVEGKLKCRWDNAPHHPELPNAPHHKHNTDESVTGIPGAFDIFNFLNEIEYALRKKN